MKDVDYRAWLLATVKVGQAADIGRLEFERAFRCGWPSIYRTSRQRFLSFMPGSAWGEWTCELDGPADRYVIRRNKGDPTRRVYVDPDREHLFHRQGDGTLVPIDELRRRHKEGL